MQVISMKVCLTNSRIEKVKRNTHQNSKIRIFQIIDVRFFFCFFHKNTSQSKKQLLYLGKVYDKIVMQKMGIITLK
jgi:hypothetical protein